MHDDKNIFDEPELEIDVETAPIDETSDRSLAEAMRTAALAINSATRNRIGSKEAFDPDGVHEIRVATKRLRALWQLVRPVIEPFAEPHDLEGVDGTLAPLGPRDPRVNQGQLDVLYGVDSG